MNRIFRKTIYKMLFFLVVQLASLKRVEVLSFWLITVVETSVEIVVGMVDVSCWLWKESIYLIGKSVWMRLLVLIVVDRYRTLYEINTWHKYVTARVNIYSWH
jgi:hypothetical protein